MKIKRIAVALALAVCLGFSTFAFAACGSNHTHDWGEWKVTAAPTCMEKGEKTRVCLKSSKHKETQAIDPLGHDWGEWFLVTEPSGTIVGEEMRVCKHDLEHFELREIPATGAESDYPTLGSNHALFRLNPEERYHAYADGWVYVSVEEYTDIEEDNYSNQIIVPATEPSPPPRILYRMRPDGSQKQQMPEYFDFSQYQYSGGWLYVIGTNNSFFRMRFDGSEKQSLSSEIVTSFVMHGQHIYYKATYDYNLRRMKTDGSQDELIENECHSFIIDGDYIFMVEGPSYTNRCKMARFDLDGKNKTYLIGEDVLDSLSVLFVSGDYLYYYVYSNVQEEENKLLRMKFDGSDIQTILTHEKDYSLQNIYYKDGYIYFNRSYNNKGYMETEICKVNSDGTDMEQISDAYRCGNFYFATDSYMMSADAIIYASLNAEGDVLLNWQYIDGYYSHNYLIGNFGSHYQGYFVHNNKIYVATSINPADTYNTLWIDGYFDDYKDGWVYTRSYDKHYKMRPDGSEKQEIDYSDYFLEFNGNKNGDWIYYVAKTDSYTVGCEVFLRFGICRERLDGTDKEVLADDVSSYSGGVKIHDGWIYFSCSAYDGSRELCRMKLDGTDKQTINYDFDSSYIEAGYIFTIKKTWLQTYTHSNTKITRYNLDGTEAKVLVDADDTDYTFSFIHDGFLYYTSYPKGSDCYNLNRIALDGTKQAVVIDHNFSPLTARLEGDWIYYLCREKSLDADNLTYTTTIYKVSTDGTNRTVIREPVSYSSSHSSGLGETSFFITEGNIYYALWYETPDKVNAMQFWKLSPEGTLTLLYDSHGVELVASLFIYSNELYIVLGN